MPNGGEFLLLIVLALVILGPDKLPEYAAKLARFVRSARDMAEGAKSQIKEEMGPGFADVDWRALDPRQYDPRRIVRDALSTPAGGAAAGVAGAGVAGAGGAGAGVAGVGDAAGREPTETPAGRAANEAAIAGSTGRGARLPRAQDYDAARPTPWDVDAT